MSSDLNKITSHSYLNVFPRPGVMIVGHPEVKDNLSYNQFISKLEKQNPKMSRDSDEFAKFFHRKLLSKRVIRFDVAENYEPGTIDRLRHDSLLNMLANEPCSLEEMKPEEIEILLQRINQELHPPNYPNHVPMGKYREVDVCIQKDKSLTSNNAGDLFSYVDEQGEEFQEIFRNIRRKTDTGLSIKDLIDADLLTKEEKETVEKTYQVFFYVFPAHKEVKDLMQKFTQELLIKIKQGEDPVAIACFAHQQLTEIHPFLDGNGRTARALMNLILIQSGRKPVIFVSGKKYTEAVRTRDKDPKIFEAFVRRCVEAVEAEERLDTWYRWGSVLHQVPKDELDKLIKSERSGS